MVEYLHGMQGARVRFSLGPLDSPTIIWAHSWQATLMMYHTSMEDISLENGNKRMKTLMVIFAVIASFLVYHLADLMDILPYFLDTRLAR